MADFTIAYDPGFTLDALVYNDAALAWNGTAFVDPSGAAWPTCAVAMTFNGSTGAYEGSMPSSLPSGTYTVVAYLRRGGSPVDGDPNVGFASVFWPGTATIPAGGAFRAALIARLNADATVAAMVGNRVFPQVRPQRSALPAIAVRVISLDRDHDLDGPTGVADAEVEIRAFGVDFTHCDQIAEYLRTLFDGMTGVIANGVEVLETLSQAESDDWDNGPDGSDDGVFQIPIEYSFRFRESAPNREG